MTSRSRSKQPATPTSANNNGLTSPTTPITQQPPTTTLPTPLIQTPTTTLTPTTSSTNLVALPPPSSMIPLPPGPLSNAAAAAMSAAYAASPQGQAAAQSHAQALPYLMPTPSSPMMVHVVRLATGAEVHTSLLEFLRVHRAEAATILSAVGSLTHCNLRFSNVASDQVKPLPTSHYEVVSLVGTLSLSGGNHIHMSVSDGKGVTLGGHLMPHGNIVYTTLELVIGVMPGLVFKRELDPTFGYEELVVYPAPQKMQLGFPLDMGLGFVPMGPPMPQLPTVSMKRKPEDDKSQSSLGSAAKKPKNTKVKKETNEQKDNTKLNSALTLANMPIGGTPSEAASPSPSDPSTSSSKPQAQYWNSAQFTVFLKSLKLDHLVPVFQWNKVDAKQFLELKLTDIRDRLGIRDPADVANVLNCINILRGTTTTQTDASATTIKAPGKGK